MEHNNQHNNIGNGFLLGVIVGILLTLLFTTKRGREIFKDIMEKGVEKFSNLEQLVKKTEKDIENDEDDYEGAQDFTPTKPVAIEQLPVEKAPTEATEEKEPTK